MDDILVSSPANCGRGQMYIVSMHWLFGYGLLWQTPLSSFAGLSHKKEAPNMFWGICMQCLFAIVLFVRLRGHPSILSNSCRNLDGTLRNCTG